MSRTPLPIEVVGDILERAVRATIENQPKFAVSLQLVSRTTLYWLLPVLYDVFVVNWPQDGQEDTPSLAFLLQLCTDGHTSRVRPHIRHIAFVLATEQDDIQPLQLPSSTFAREWMLESVAGDGFDFIRIMLRLQLRPRRIFLHENGGCGIIVFGGIVQQSAAQEEVLPALKALCGQLEEVETACVIHPAGGIHEADSRVTASDLCSELSRLVNNVMKEQPNRPMHMRIAIDLDGYDSVANAVRLVVSTLRCPRVSVTLVLPLRASIQDEHDVALTDWDPEPTARAFCDALSTEEALSVGSQLRQKLRITLGTECQRAKNSVEYIRKVRCGRPLYIPERSLDDL